MFLSVFGQSEFMAAQPTRKVPPKSNLEQMVIRSFNPDREPSTETVKITEKELNDYIAASIQKNKPAGLRKMIMELKPNDTFYARAFVNGDEIKFSEEGWTGKILRSMLKGDQLLEVDGHIEMINDKFKYDVDAMRVNGMSIPAGLTREIASYLLKDKLQNKLHKTSFTDPIDLVPYGISKVRIEDDCLLVQQR